MVSKEQLGHRHVRCHFPWEADDLFLFFTSNTVIIGLNFRVSPRSIQGGTVKAASSRQES